MLNRQRRMAGQALAALPEENITQQLSAALERLRQVTPGAIDNDDFGYVNVRDYPVRGETSVAFGPDGFNDYDGRFQVGNAAELKRIEEAGINDILEIAWHSPEIEVRPRIPQAPTRSSLSDTENTPAGLAKRYQLQDKRTALEARSSWADYFAGLPDNVLLHNRPVGGMSGDYARADLYMREGFGPVGENGAQYAIKRNGQLEPVAPMGTHQEYAEHLRNRMALTGEEKVSASISSELQRRKDKRETLLSPEQLEDERREQEYRARQQADNNYEPDYDDYDDGGYGGGYDDYEDDPRSEYAQLSAISDYDRLVDSATSPNPRSRRSDEQQMRSLRNAAEELGASGVATPERIQGIREMQTDVMSNLMQARDNLNFVNERFDRPVPMPITSSPYQEYPRRNTDWDSRRSDFYSDVSELATDIQAGNDYNLAKGSPENLRGFAKQRFIRPNMRPDGVLEIRENYGPNEVQMLRDLQVQQAMNPKMDDSGSAAYGISSPLDMVSSDVPVQWVTQDGRSLGTAAPITGAAGSERGMVMRRNNWEQDGELHRGNTIDDWRTQNRLQQFVDESGGRADVLFPGYPDLADPWNSDRSIPF